MLRRIKGRRPIGDAALLFNNKGPLSMEGFRRVLERERERANRNQHSVSLVLIEIETLQHDPGKILRAVQSIRTRIRQVDEIGWFDQERIGIILPYTTKEGACHLTQDLVGQFKDQIPKPRFDVFTFMSDFFQNISDKKLDSSGAPK